jgi:hypothetical protein
MVREGQLRLPGAIQGGSRQYGTVGFYRRSQSPDVTSLASGANVSEGNGR